nr:MAG TPA: hypothetical protein [Caudoviricetes sp.]
MFIKHNFHYLRPIYSPKTLTFCYPMPFFRVFRVFRAWLWEGAYDGIQCTPQAAGRVIRDARATGESAGNACMSGVSCASCAGRAGRAGQAGRAGRAGRAGARMAHCSICLFYIVRFANMSCIKRTFSHACKGAPPRHARPASRGLILTFVTI